MSSKRKKQRTFIKKRWFIFSALLLTITVGAALWLAEQRGAWLTVLPAVIFTVLGAIIALGQWFFPASSNAPVQTLPHPHQTQNQSRPADLPPSTSTSVSPPTTQSITTGTLAAIPKVTFRSLIGFPPPTDPRTVQQRETTVKEVYARLTQDDTTALVLTGIGGVGKSTLAALIYRFAEERRKAGEGPFTAPALWLKIDSSSVTMSDLIGTIFDALGIPVPDVGSLAPHNQALTLLHGFETVAGKRLIVLDQFENLLDWQTGRALPDRPGVGEWLDAINSQPCVSRFLLTSRPWPLSTTGYPPTYMQEYHV